MESLIIHWACDSAGKVHVTDYNNHRIQVFTVEKHGENEGNLPFGIAIDISGLIYIMSVSVEIIVSLHVLTSEGQFFSSLGIKRLSIRGV